MNYDLQVEDVSSIRRRLRFTLPGDVVRTELERAYGDLKGRVKLAGFRPGKVPRSVLEARFGRQIRNEVGAKLIDESYKRAARDLDVAGQPAIEQRGELEGGQAFSFTIAVDVKPKVEVVGYKGMQVKYPAASLSEDTVNAAVRRELARRARIEEVDEDRPVQDGDFVLTEVKLVRGEEVLVDEPGTMINTRGERYYPGVESLVVGLKKGESRSGEVNVGANAEIKHIAGASVEATVRVHSIQAHKIPELNDATATELGYEGGAEGMTAAVRMRLQEQLDDASRNQARVNLLQKLVDQNKLDVPKGLIEEQFQLLVEELRVRRTYGGQDPRSVRFSDAEIADLRERALFAARASVLLAGIARQEGIEVTDGDIDEKIREIADMRGQAVEAIRGYLERENAVEMLRNRILEERTLDWLMEQGELIAVDPAELRDPRDSDGEGDAAAQAAAEQAAAEQAAAPAVEQAAAPAEAPAQAESPIEVAEHAIQEVAQEVVERAEQLVEAAGEAAADALEKAGETLKKTAKRVRKSTKDNG